MSDELSVTVPMVWVEARFHSIRVVKDALDDLGHKGLSGALDRELQSMWRVISPSADPRTESKREGVEL